jgi:hypothetical protein
MNLVPALARLVVSRFGWLFATGDERDAEILALRHQGHCCIEGSRLPLDPVIR